MGYHENQLNKHLSEVDADAEREEAIETLAERLMKASETAINGVMDSSGLFISHHDITKAIEIDDSYSEVFTQIATHLIDTNDKRDF